MTEHALDTNSPATSAEEPEKKETLGSFLWFVAKLVIAVLIFRSFIFSPFTIPSESMLPNLRNGDYLVAAKWPYGFSKLSLPGQPALFEGRIFASLPERGDVVIFKHPVTGADYVKRVIGLPGDIVEVRGGQVVLNGVAVRQKAMKPLRIPVDGNAPCDPGQFPGARVQGKDGRDYCELPVRQEILPNGKTYVTIDMGPSALDWYGPVRVPADHVFLMGDNRDNSADSRAPLAENGLGGPVPWEAIGGRAEFITFSLDGDAGWNPATWLHAFRSGRAGNSLRPRSVAAAD